MKKSNKNLSAKRRLVAAIATATLAMGAIGAIAINGASARSGWGNLRPSCEADSGNQFDNQVGYQFGMDDEQVSDSNPYATVDSGSADQNESYSAQFSESGDSSCTSSDFPIADR